MIFFFVGKEGSGNCKKLMDCFSDLCHEFGIPLASDKSVGPVTMLTFLGLDIDTENMLIKIPQSKLDALVQMLEQFLTGKNITFKDLQSLVGSLSFFFFFCFQIHTQNYFKYFYHRPVNVYLRFKTTGI